MIARTIRGILDSPNMPGRRPVVDSNFESSVRGLYVIGDLAGAPVVKLAMEQGHQVAQHIAAKPDARASEPGAYDLVVAGAGAAGLNAALTAQELGLRVLVLEKNKIANTIEDFPEGKWVYAEPDARPPKGKLWLDGARKEDLLARWREIIAADGLDVRTEEGLTGIARKGGHFEVRTSKAVYRTRRIVLATGQRGNPRRLGLPGEDREQVYHRLYSPRHYKDEDILVVGGGNSAVEAALTLSEQNRVVLSYRGNSFQRVFKENRRKLDEAVKRGSIRVIFNSNVRRFDDGIAVLDVESVPYTHAFVLIGAEIPTEFLRSLGIRLENDWTPSRFVWLAVLFLICYTIFGAKQSPGGELWPFRGWGYEALSVFDRPWSFWYTVLYTFAMTVFGIQAMKRWGFDRKDRFQIWRYTSLLGFQWLFFFLVPEFLFQWAVKYQWVGDALASDPNFAGQAWRSYGLIYAWPLFFYTFFGAPHQVWVAWGALLSFVILPVLVLFHGKRYCSWICGCGGLAETLGDRWRHLAPKGKISIQWEFMNGVVLAAAVLVTVGVLAADVFTVLRKPANTGLEYYHLIADVWLVGILPVSLYPVFGGKIWCRYWCPLAKMMELFSAVYTRFRVSRFAIHANEKCIACGECTRNCQVGIDVMSFALKQDELNNANSSCIGCGICVTVCPMNVLSFERQPRSETKLVQIAAMSEWMIDQEKTQEDAIRTPEGLPTDVIVSPDTQRANRVPPGQSRTKKWPVLDASGPPRIDLGKWRLRVGGLVVDPIEWTWQEFMALPRIKVFADFHCVTRWSRLGNLWEGVSALDLLARAGGVKPGAKYVLAHGYDYGWSTNLPLDDFLADDALVAILHDGEPISVDHGGPARLIVPQLYAWKSAKWLSHIEVLDQDRAGLWERNGYHMHGDPWKEERYGY